jgi:hypothetical protein
MRRAEPRWRVLAAVILLHGLLVLVLHGLMVRPPPPASTAPALQWVTLPPLAPPETRPPELTRARAVTVRPVAVPPIPREAPPTGTLQLVEAPPRPPEPPSSAASAPTGSVLDSPATRQALRGLGQRPLLSERAAQAMGEPVQRTDTALADEVQRAAKGDCLKGEFAGSGMGLLSLPALAVAAARGQCAR